MNYPPYLDPIEGADRAFLDDWREGAIRQAAEYAYRMAPVVRDAWNRAGVTPSDFTSSEEFSQAVPLIDKDSIRYFRDKHSDPLGGLGSSIPGMTVSIGTTSGTTGDPTPVPNWICTGSEQGYARDGWQIGARPGDYITHMLFTFRGGHRRRYNAQFGFPEIFFTMSPGDIALAVDASLQFRPTLWHMCSTPVLLMLESLFERSDHDPVDVFSSYKGAIFGGEPLSGRLKALTKSWGFEMFETTSLGEVLGATECQAHDGFHAYEDMAFIETIDPVSRTPLADGEIGELVVTSLDDRLTPLIRYATGDLVTIDRSLCACGRNHARFKILGRASDQTIINGRSVLPRDLMEILADHSETRAALFQIVRTEREMDKLILRIGYDPNRLQDDLFKLEGRLCATLTECLDLPVQIELVCEAELLKLGPPHKIPRVTNA